MSYVDGVNINDPTDGIKEEPQRKVLAGELSDYLKEKIFASANGVYPSDLHSGNILKTRTTNKIVLIDTGQVGRITPVARERVMKFLLFSAIGDVQGTAEALQQMKNPSREESIDQEGLVSKITELMGEAGEPIERVRDLFAHAPFYGLFIDPVYMDLLKGIMTFQGTALSLDPQFTFVSMDAAQTADHAQNEVLKQDGTIGKKGGIDFNPEEMHLQVQNNGGAIKFNLDPSMIQQLQNAPGFSPIIIDMQPLNSVQMFLGLNDSADKMAAVH
jgi:predicted unusual protein kinase regulating ubiquinone biosynthesis (AarF/ABC1/UbiB family)